MKNTATILKTSAMAVSMPRYVGILFYASGFSLTSEWGLLKVAELVAGCALALLEGFAISYMVDRVQLNTSKIEQGLIIAVACVLLLLLPLAAVPSMYFAFTSTSLFAVSQNDISQAGFTCFWLFMVASIPIFIIIGVGLTQSDPMERKHRQAIKQAETEQAIARLKAETQQKVTAMQAETERYIAEVEAETRQVRLRYQLENKQTKAEFKQRSSKIEQDTEQAQADRSKPFACACGDSFASQKALSGHMAHCKIKNNGNVMESMKE